MRRPESQPGADDPAPAPTAQGRPRSSDRLLACYRRALGHDLPNLLVAVQGMARLLESGEEGPLPEGLREYVSRIRRASRRAHEMVVLLAEIGRVAREAVPGPPADLAETAAAAAAEVQGLFPGRTIFYDLSEATGTLPAPRKHVHLLLVQLLQNGVAAVPPERVASVRVDRGPAGSLPGFRVTDNGSGLPGERLQQVREFLAGRELLERGLGLFLVREILEAHGGVAHVETDPGQGCTFTLAFPRV
jgi:signal transduction histidine kinase